MASKILFAWLFPREAYSVKRPETRLIRLISSSDLPTPVSPCGICRQVIREFCALDMPIILVPAGYSSEPTKEGRDTAVYTSLGELLPHSFGPEHLELKRQQ